MYGDQKNKRGRKDPPKSQREGLNNQFPIVVRTQLVGAAPLKLTPTDTNLLAAKTRAISSRREVTHHALV